MPNPEGGTPASTWHATISRPRPRANAACPSDEESTGSERLRTSAPHTGAPDFVSSALTLRYQRLASARDERSRGAAASTSRMAALRCANAASARPDLRSQKQTSVWSIAAASMSVPVHASDSPAGFRTSSTNDRISAAASTLARCSDVGP